MSQGRYAHVCISDLSLRRKSAAGQLASLLRFHPRTSTHLFMEVVPTRHGGSEEVPSQLSIAAILSLVPLTGPC